MRESSTYQAILNEGRVEALQKMLLRQGRHRFGSASKAVQAEIAAITNVERLERMTEALAGRVQLAGLAKNGVTDRAGY